jgi:alkylhydroperoxidase/carboxymuconolactone decarboxylase family protein YurZ
MQESQLKIYNYIKNSLNQSLCDNKTRILILLAYAILSGNKSSIGLYVKVAIRYGATHRDFLKVISCIMGDARLMDSIMELFRIIDKNFKGNNK